LNRYSLLLDKAELLQNPEYLLWIVAIDLILFYQSTVPLNKELFKFVIIITIEENKGSLKK